MIVYGASRRTAAAARIQLAKLLTTSPRGPESRHQPAGRSRGPGHACACGSNRNPVCRGAHPWATRAHLPRLSRGLLAGGRRSSWRLAGAAALAGTPGHAFAPEPTRGPERLQAPWCVFAPAAPARPWPPWSPRPSRRSRFGHEGAAQHVTFPRVISEAETGERKRDEASFLRPSRTPQPGSRGR